MVHGNPVPEEMRTALRNIHRSMMEELEQAPDFLPSEFWRTLNTKNLVMLEEDGLANFKRSVSQNYYNWLIVNPLQRHFRHIFRDWLTHPTLAPALTRVEDSVRVRLTTTDKVVSLSWWQRRLYGLYVGCVWERMLRLDRSGLADIVFEPEIGNPIRIWRRSKLISQDLANSIAETNLLDQVHGERTGHLRIAEFGAGSGRLAHAYMSTHRGTYYIFDIPPALVVSHWYLQGVLPDRSFFPFTPFRDFRDVQHAIERADIAFFTANQILLFPPQYFDTIVSISTLPEVTRSQAQMFLELFQRYARRHIFLKQWKQWKNPLDGTHLATSDYTLKPDWHLILDQDDAINPLFFNRVWRRDTPD